MKQFKDYINNISGLRYFFESIEINSSFARKKLLNQEIFSDKEKLNKEFDNVVIIENYLKNLSENNIQKIKNNLAEIRDISLTISNLANENILDDIELFEIKHFVLIFQNLFEIFESTSFPFLNETINLIDVLNILDPENTRISSFYIYSKYDTELEILRNKEIFEKDSKKREEIRIKSIEIEDRIRKKLTKSLQKFTKSLQLNLDFTAYIDILISKSELFKKLGLCRPKISEKEIEIKEFWNPEIANILAKKNKKYQKINIAINNSPIIITGANMSGKTVILKTIAQIQYLFQFGFFVPAKEAKLEIFEEIYLCVGDEQSELSGLSSFAGEMQKINKIIESVKSNKKTLAFVDELARTTNPREGIAIIKSFTTLMKKYSVPSLITTHYNIELSETIQLKVKGLKINTEQKVTIENIGDYMDYELETASNSNNNSNDALKIAEILEIDSELIELAKKII